MQLLKEILAKQSSAENIIFALNTIANAIIVCCEKDKFYESWTRTDISV